MLPEGKCRYIDGQIYPDGNFYVLDTQHIKHNESELKSALNGINTDISNKVDKVAGKGLSTEDYTTAEKNKLSGIEVNANNYVHPTTSGNKHIPSGGSSGKILGWSADGTAAWVDPASGGGSVDTVYIGSTEYAPDANGKVTLPTYPTTLPASDVYSWAKASTKPSYTYSEVGAAPTNHNHYQLSTIGDYRSASTKPDDYPNLMQFKGLKQNSVIGNPSADTYSYVLGLRGWSDSSGGNTHEFAFNNSGIYTRTGASTSWGSWEKLAMTSDIPTTLPASDVYAWAKASSKPTYTASEVGAAPASHTHNYAASSSAGGPATSVLTNGADVKLGTSGTSSNDSGDIVFLYGNSSEKLRIYTDNEYTAKTAPLCRERDASGNTLYDGCLVLGDGTGASGTWNITSASANKLNTNAGSVTRPVYFNNGVPTATTYSLAKSVPSDAKFTDTTYTFGTGDSWGQIKITPSGGSTQNVSVNDTISEWTSGSVNNVTKSCTLRFGRYCTDLPQDGAVWLVDTKLSDANTGYQTAVALTINTVDGNLVGKMYVRIKASGTWSNWRLLTN